MLHFSTGWLLTLLCAGAACAQQVTIGTPLRSARSSFFEGTNVGWSFNVKNRAFFRFGSPTQGRPPFGGFNPNAGLSGGFGVRRGGYSANFGFNFSQGASRTFTSTTPVLTMTPGQRSSLFVGRQRPFVTGLLPVVNGGSQPVFQNLGSTGLRGRLMRGELQAARLRDRLGGQEPAPATEPKPVRRREPQSLIDPLPPTRAERETQRTAESAARQAKAADLFRRGRAAETAGKSAFARIYYHQAARYADGALKANVAERLAALGR